MSVLRLWFGLSEPVDRRTYAVTGAALMLLKYLVDLSVVYAVTGRVWTPLDYLNPVATLRFGPLEQTPSWLLLWMGFWTLPFVWIGLSMSVRRAVDAGVSPWHGFWFLVPIVNYAFMLLMCLLPSRAPASDAAAHIDLPTTRGRAQMLMLATLVPVLTALLMLAVSAFVLGRYGSTLFVGTPLAMGALSGFLANRDRPRGLDATIGLAIVCVLATGGALLLFALEGAICLAMALPLAIPLAVLGACIGRAIALQAPDSWAHASVLVLLLPFLAAAELPQPRVREVLSTVEIGAPADVVWENVVGFRELPPPTEWYFRRGIAYPVRARIDGRGVGAIRRCEFSTGAFVEPITAWEAPRRLAFDVAAQPPPMHEWSPYDTVHAPHLDDYLRSRRGEFRLVPLASGGTRLEGRTWYEVEIFPQAYWQPWADALIHRIHDRVLRHVKALSES